MVMKSKTSFLNKELDKTLATLGLILSIILILYLSIYIGRFIYILTGVLTLVSCIIWLFIRNKAIMNTDFIQESQITPILISLFFIFFSLSIIALKFRYNDYQRPLIYFILTSLMVGITCVEIFYTKKYYIIFIQILVIGFSLSLSQLFLFPGVLGVDPWWHEFFTYTILKLSYIPENFSYSSLPLFHLMITITMLVTGFNYKLATIFSVASMQIICDCFFIFLIGNKVINNLKVGLLASLLLIIANHHIFMSYWSIPNGFSTIYVIILMFIFLILNKNSMIRLITFILLLTTILSHSITSMFLLLILFISFISSKFYVFTRHKYLLPPVSLNYCILFFVSMLSWWAFSSGHLKSLANLLEWGFSRDIFVTTPVEVLSKYAVHSSFLGDFFSYIGMFLFFALSFIGCFWMISEKNGNISSFILSLIGLTPLMLGFFSLISQHSIIEHRWWFFAEIFLSIPLAISMILICNLLKNNFSKILYLFIFSILFSFLMITPPIANVDNPLYFQNNSMRSAITVSELQALKTTSGFNIEIKTDEYYASTHKFTMDVSSFDEQIFSNIYELTDSLVLIRKEIVNKSMKSFASLVILNYDLRSLLENMYFSKIYDCGSVEGFVH